MDTTNTNMHAWYLDLHLEIYSKGRLRTKLYDKRDYLNSPTFHLCAIFQQHPHMEYTSQLIRYSRACSSYQDFLDRGLVAANKEATESSWLSWSHHFKSFAITTMTWLIAMEYLFHKWPRICFTCRKYFPVLSSFITYHRVCN
jgi:hypothetical protein